MAIIATQSKLAVSLKLDNGSTESGSQKTVTQSLGSINPEAVLSSSLDAFWAIGSALAPCLEKTVVRLEAVSTNTLEDNE